MGYHLTMDPSGVPAHRLDPRAKRVWRIYAFIGSALALFVCAAFVAGMVLIEAPTFVWALALVATLVGAVLWIGPSVELMYRRWRWEITDVEVRLQSGLIVVKRTVIPMARIQHVDTTQGPLLRAFGLSEVHVSTAAGVHKIPKLADEDAGAIRDRIAALAQVTDDGGL